MRTRRRRRSAVGCAVALAGVVALVAAPGAVGGHRSDPGGRAAAGAQPAGQGRLRRRVAGRRARHSLIDADDYDPAAHQLTAIVADSTVNLYDARWLDATITRSEGELVLPLVADGPLWDYSVNGSVLTQANPLFPINRRDQPGRDADRLIIAQGVNNASPDMAQRVEQLGRERLRRGRRRRRRRRRLHRDRHPGLQDRARRPEREFGPASAAERAELDEAATWMRLKAFTDPRFVVADWHALSVSRPDWWLNDVHPDQDGSDQYEALITRTARKCPDPGAWPAPTPPSAPS